ncbi:MAG: glycosyltransferase family 2 protein [Alphaproteobacteria bacterium]
MRISAIVVTYKTGEILFSGLSALLNAEGVDEIVVVDNGNPQPCAQRLDALASNETKLRIVRGQGNVGFARACNLGAAMTRGELLLFINPDVVLEPRAARQMAEALAKLPAPAIVGGDLRDGSGWPDRGSRRDRVTPWRAIISYSGLHVLGPWLAPFRDLHRHQEPVPEAMTPVGAVSGALLMMRRGDFLAVAGFDESYFLHFEDVDLCRRVEDVGGAIVFVPGALGTHERSTSDVSPLWVTAHKFRGLALYLWKHAQTPAEQGIANLLRRAMDAVLAPLDKRDAAA